MIKTFRMFFKFMSIIVGVILFCDISSYAKDSEYISIYFELKDNYKEFKIPELFIHAYKTNEWKNGYKASEIYGSFDDRTLCPFMVTQDEYNAPDYFKLNGRHHQDFKLVYAKADFIDLQKQAVIRLSSTGKMELVKGDSDHTSFEKYLEIYRPDKSVLFEHYFSVDGTSYIKCPAGDQHSLFCMVHGLYEKNISYGISIPKDEISNYQSRVDSAFKIFGTFEYDDHHLYEDCKKNMKTGAKKLAM